ncbi:golgin candidate 3-like isoform X2 [Cucurbita moschata]|uniref:Golgin candidate 3-like isoform X2 n=1 Tax=Cucurbita moschata TaxID=3662 RepID=A0A6J1H7B7_CUCMO|nr:golgin candidate 3-like isoform X2 [Cucurbita moschata]
MMWSSIANLKENLNKIALDVHHDDDEEEFAIYGSNGGDVDVSVSDRRNSHSFAHSNPVTRSPIANGIEDARHPEIEQYKTEIKRLQESERDIKSLSMNYAALLKEKEELILRLNKENGSLKQSLEGTNTSTNSPRAESSKSPSNGTNEMKGSDQSPTRLLRGKTRRNGIVSKQDGITNGASHSGKLDYQSKMVPEHSTSQELTDFQEGNIGSLQDVQTTLEMKQLRKELQQEREQLADVQLRLREEQKLNKKFQEELNSLHVNKDKASLEMSNIIRELNEKKLEVKQLQVELNRRENMKSDDNVEGLKRLITKLEKEKSTLEMGKKELEDTLEKCRTSSSVEAQSSSLEMANRHLSGSNEKLGLSGISPGKEDMDLSLQKLKKDLKEMQQERDKAVHELSRLKQHLLEKESEESEKMDEDSRIIEELRHDNEYQRGQILHLEKALNQAIATQKELEMYGKNELQKSKEIIEELNRKLANYMSIIDSKNVELLNLQTALGQYYAEIEAKEHLESDLAREREGEAKLSQMLKDANQREDALNKEKEEILSKLSLSERALGEWKSRVNKLEEDNSKLRRALDQSMTRLNRMSVDSDFLVDRRIVIKLLVTYFQKNHSKEVLDLMVRMLGFSEDDKMRIGAAKQGPSKGVVRGVLGFPGRLVGGILGGSSAETPANMASDNQSFADLWVDFLLKENEEREKREAKESLKLQEGSQLNGPNVGSTGSQLLDPGTKATGSTSESSRTGFPSHHHHHHQSTHLPFGGDFRLSRHHSESEFSTVPLTSTTENTHYSSRPLPKY